MRTASDNHILVAKTILDLGCRQQLELSKWYDVETRLFGMCNMKGLPINTCGLNAIKE
jgi:hypothetical protein